MPKTPRQGILAAGNFIVDYVKIIDGYPAQDMLASILSAVSYTHLTLPTKRIV